MDNIILGLFKSNHKIALKTCIVDKLLVNDRINKNNETSQIDLDLNQFLHNLETIWLNNYHDLDSQNLIRSYYNLKENYDLLRKVISYYVEKIPIRPNIKLDPDVLLNHWTELYKKFSSFILFQKVK